MKLTKIAMAFSFFLLVTASVNAQTQKARIKEGVQSGELTKRETKTLVKQQHETRQDVKAAKADGVITPDEKTEIKQDKVKSSKAIYRKKHNARDRN